MEYSFGLYNGGNMDFELSENKIWLRGKVLYLNFKGRY